MPPEPSDTNLQAFRERLLGPRSTNPRERSRWLLRREQLRRDLNSLLGLAAMPERLPLDMTEEPAAKGEGWQAHRIRFAAWPDVHASGWMVSPVEVEPRLPLLIRIPESPWKPADLLDLLWAVRLARRGAACCVLDGFVIEHAGADLTSAGTLVWRHLRLLECLGRHSSVDRARTGLAAAGPGCTLAALLLAADERISAAALSGAPGYSRDLAAGSGDALTLTLPRGLSRVSDLPELLSAFAPRPLMLEFDPGDAAAQAAFGEVLNVYGLFGLQQRLSDRNVGFQPGGEDDWLLRQLRVEPDRGAGPISEADQAAMGEALRQSEPSFDPSEGERVGQAYAERVTAQPPRLEGRAARKTFQQRLRAELEQLLGEPEESPLEPLTGPAMQVELGADLPPVVSHAVSFYSEAGSRIEGLLLSRPSGPHPAVVMDALSLDEPLSELQAALLSAGITLLRVRSRLFLEGQREWDAALHLAGRSAVGLAARDMVAAVDYLVRTGDVDQGRIALIGEGPAGVAALLAGARDPRIAAIAADCGNSTYRDGGQGLPRFPGILRLADVPQIASLSAPRPLWLYRVPADRAGFSSRRFYDWVERTYRSLGAVDALRLQTGESPGAPDLVEWLRSVWRKQASRPPRGPADGALEEKGRALD